MKPIISISNLAKTYASGLKVRKSVNLEIRKGEIFALLGPNGAGKTTTIDIVCGIVTPTSGTGARRRPRYRHDIEGFSAICRSGTSATTGIQRKEINSCNRLSHSHKAKDLLYLMSYKQ